MQGSNRNIHIYHNNINVWPWWDPNSQPLTSQLGYPAVVFLYSMPVQWFYSGVHILRVMLIIIESNLYTQ